MDQDGPELQKGRPILRATTIDEFLKENGADVDLDGLCTEEQSFEDNSEEEDSMALNQNYYKYVMADIDEDEGGTKKKKTRGHTTCAKIYNRTMEEREEVTFDIGDPIGPIPQSVSNLTSFVGTIGRKKRFVTLLYTSWHAVPQHKKIFMWRYVNEVSQRNKKNKEQQKFPHRTGLVNFARVRAALRELKGTNEEPKRFEVFIATRTSRKRKELDEGTQSAI
ncbi:hypothetical protein PIB30_102201, partial [Stylosanthes scabra]|nr:hypothetical protein [Stylosanthes scabra]